MLASLSTHKSIWLTMTLAVLSISLSVTSMYENFISDGISISISTLAIIILMTIATIWLFDVVNDICNP